MSDKQDKQNDYLRKSALPFLAGLFAYLQVAALIPRAWNIFPRIPKNGNFFVGIVEGIGEVRNLMGTASGLMIFEIAKHLSAPSIATETKSTPEKLGDAEPATALGQSEFTAKLCTQRELKNDFGSETTR